MNDAPHGFCWEATGNGEFHDDLQPAWDVVFKTEPKIIQHIIGEKIDPNISLAQCIEALHTAGVKLGAASFYPALLLAMFARYPAGAFASRVGSDVFAKDVNDIWEGCIKVAREQKQHAAELRATLLDPWADLPPPQWPAGVLRRGFEDTVAEITLADGVDMGAQAMAFITAASGACDKQSRLDVYLNGRFLVPPVVWTMVLAESGMRKSPILQTAFAPIKRANGRRWRDYQTEMKCFAALKPEDQRDACLPVQPSALFVDDITPEKLAEVLATEPRGTLMLKEELVALFDFGRYSSSAGAAGRGFLVTTYDAGETWFHRKSSGVTHIANAAMAIYGCTQPARLAKFKDLEDDGLLQRFLITRPSRTTGGSNPAVQVRSLDNLENAIVGLLHCAAMQYRLSPTGADMVRATERLGEEWERHAEAGLGFPAWARKMHGQHARLALVLHLMEAPAEASIADDVVERAGRLMREYLLPNAYRFYYELPDSGLTLLRSTAGWLLTKASKRFTAGNVQQGVAGCQRKPLKFIQGALDPLVTGGWLEPETEYPNNNAWSLNDGVREMFAERTIAERERRAALAALVRGQR
jgi:Protein of unknown function (DUF3987)